jgi:hypothetical protein
MKKLVFVVTLLFGVLAWADGPELSGYWEFNERVLTKSSDVPFADMYSRLRLRMHSDINDHLSAHVSGDLRLYNRTGVIKLKGLSDPGSSFHIDATLWEAYLALYDVVEGLDLTIGKQRIAWGTADKLNPTDNLNPYDLSDVFNMWEHVPTLAVKLSYTLNDYFGFDLIWEPTAKPALLPRDDALQGVFTSSLQDQFAGNMAMIKKLGLTLADPDVSVHAPPFDLKHSVEGVKVRGTIVTVDYSVSYIHGWHSIPVVTNVDVHLDKNNPKQIDTIADATLFEYHMAGMDLAWDLWGIGWRLEGAVFFPAGGVNTVIKAPDPDHYFLITERQVTAVPDHPYFNLTAGLDYTFSCNFYINFQYAHGMMFEFGDEKDIHDYFILRLEQSFLYDKLKISLNGMFGAIDWSDLKNHYTWMVSPELKWIPYDSVELALGGFIIDARGGGMFAAIKDLDTVYLKTTVNF